MKPMLVLLIVIGFATSQVFAQRTIKVKHAYRYMGQTVRICDTIFSRIASHYAGLYEWKMGSDKKEKRLIIQFDPKYISFLKNGSQNQSKYICVTGKLTGSKEFPIIRVTDSTQISN